MPKIKRSWPQLTIYFLFVLLVLTRFWNLSWGLPDPFHPDERNIADSLMQLHCGLKDCMNPHFFAYGQFPLYLGYIFVQAYHLLVGSSPTSFIEATVSLRIISAIASLFTVIVSMLLIRACIKKSHIVDIVSSVLLIFSPALIQFAHFGTTESLLMLGYISTIYISILFLQKKVTEKRFLVFTSIVVGLSIGTKVSALIYLTVPFITLIYLRKFSSLFLLSLGTAVVAVIGSPYNVILFDDFFHSIMYETNIARGVIPVFYTQQFFQTQPVLFQLTHIFPYALGWPVFIGSLLGFFLLPWTKTINLLRIALLIYFLPNAFLYTKWTRFMAPLFPLMIIFSILVIQTHIKNVRHLFIIAVIAIVPGIAYLSIYTHEDIRVTASKWVADHIPANSYILSESGNVVDFPLDSSQKNRDYHIAQFNFYDLDERSESNLDALLTQAQYVIIPSRRVIGNYTCELEASNKCQNLAYLYPNINGYYQKLLSPSSGFRTIVELHSYPNITFLGRTLIEFPDETAEETWSVFDHPVIRIFQRF